MGAPQDTQIQSIWLPTIQAQLPLNRNDPAFALNALQTASPIELSIVSFVANLCCLDLTYVRAEALLTSRKGKAAAAEFQKILDHNSMVWNCWTGALALLGQARAIALKSRSLQGADAQVARAFAAYKDFLTL